MTENSSTICSDGFNIGNLVWARREYDGIYWPGTINFISSKSTETTSINSKLHSHQTCWYLVQYFGYDQAHWTGDVLSYRSYRDYMFKNLLAHYESYPQIKYQFIDAVNQADHADMNSKSHPGKSINHSSFKTTRNYNYHPTTNSMLTDYSHHNWTPVNDNEYPYNHYASQCHTYAQYPSNESYQSQSSVNSYCSCCIPPTLSTTDSSAQFNIDCESAQNVKVQKTYSVMIITTKTYSNSSFISYLFNSLSHCIHHPIIYIDDPSSLPITNYHHPSTSTISYLICLDHFDSHIRQTLDSTILNHLAIHHNNNYLFVLFNAPSHDLVKHFYSTVLDQRTIVVVHYHWRFENEALLLCSGDHQTYEEIRSNLLRYICPRVKYIETAEDPNKQSSSNNIIQPDNPSLNMVKSESVVEISQNHSKNFHHRKLHTTHKKKLLKRKSKKKWMDNGIGLTSPSKYYVQNILDTVSSSK